MITKLSAFTILMLLMVGRADAAAYEVGFAWNWEPDFSTTDPTPSDAGSIALAANAGKSTGAATQDVWAYLDLTTDTLGAIEPTTVVSEYGNFYGSGLGWMRDAPDGPPAFGDTALATNTSDYMFAASASQPAVPGPEHGRKFIAPGPNATDRVTVALRFTAPQKGLYNISATYRLVSWKQYNPGCTTGVKTQIVKDTTPLTEYTLLTFPNSQAHSLPGVSLNPGDHLYFALSPNGTAVDSNNCDDVLLDLQIDYAENTSAAKDWYLLK